MAVVNDKVTGAETEVCVVGVELILAEVDGARTDTVAVFRMLVDRDNLCLARSLVAFGTERNKAINRNKYANKPWN